jgi:hypothetical protein
MCKSRRPNVLHDVASFPELGLIPVRNTAVVVVSLTFAGWLFPILIILPPAAPVQSWPTRLLSERMSGWGLCVLADDEPHRRCRPNGCSSW